MDRFDYYEPSNPPVCTGCKRLRTEWKSAAGPCIPIRYKEGCLISSTEIKSTLFGIFTHCNTEGCALNDLPVEAVCYIEGSQWTRTYYGHRSTFPPYQGRSAEDRMRALLERVLALSRELNHDNHTEIVLIEDIQRELGVDYDE